MLRRLRCLFRRHQWQTEFNLETQGTERECARCGAHVSTYPGGSDLLPREDPRGHFGDGSGFTA